MTKLDKSIKIAVIAGGMSDERNISLKTGKMMYDALFKGGYTNIGFIDVDFNLDKVLRKFNPDVVVNGLHGRYGEDGTVQGLLEMMHIPYTNSGVSASAFGMDKFVSKAVMKELGIKTAKGSCITLSPDVEPPLEFPLVVKDLRNGSSWGVFIIKDEAGWVKTVSEVPKGKKVLCERYFKGREINVAVLNSQVIGDVEIIPANDFYDFESKYESDLTKYITNPDYSSRIRNKVWKAALYLHQALGCKGVTRSDFIVSYDDYVMLEINTLPGMTSHSLIPIIAQTRGISYLRLIEKIIQEALSK